MNEPTYIDRVSLLRRVDGDTELLIELIEIFFTSYPQQISALEEALQNREYLEAEHTAHSLKGALQTFFKGALPAKALACEYAAAQGNADNLEVCIAELKVELLNAQSVFEELREYLP